jgi:hypothetical protein
MVAVRVREHDGRHVTRHVSERREIRSQPPREAGQPCVDGGKPAAILDEVPVDERGAEAMDPRDDVWRWVDALILFRRVGI